MSTIYTTVDGDMLDYIAWKLFGSSSKIVEAILAANPGIAAYGPVMPAGIVITIPDGLTSITTASTEKTKLWE